MLHEAKEIGSGRRQGTPEVVLGQGIEFPDQRFTDRLETAVQKVLCGIIDHSDELATGLRFAGRPRDPPWPRSDRSRNDDDAAGNAAPPSWPGYFRASVAGVQVDLSLTSATLMAAATFSSSAVGSLLPVVCALTCTDTLPSALQTLQKPLA